MPAHFVNDPGHWQQRADEMRALAETVIEPEAKKTMLRIAGEYANLAKRAEARAEGTPTTR